MDTKELKKRITKVRWISLGFVIVTLIVSISMYEDYKTEKETFAFIGLGVLTFLAVFYTLVFQNKFKSLYNSVQLRLDQDLQLINRDISKSLKTGKYKEIKKHLDKVQDVDSDKNLTNIDEYLFSGVMAQLISVPGFLVLNEAWLPLAFMSFWLGWVCTIIIILMWYYIYSDYSRKS